MECPQCHAENAQDHRFCLKCGAVLAPAPPATVPSAGPHLAVHRRISPTLIAVIAGVVIMGFIFFVIVAAGAYFLIKSSASQSRPGGLQPSAPAQPAVPQAPQPLTPPAGGGQPQPLTPPAGGGQPQPLTPPAGGGQPQPLTPPAGGGQPQPLTPPVGGGQPQPLTPPGQAPVGPTGPEGTTPANVQMQAYQDPQGEFTIEYPQTWQVQVEANGFTVFYQDDPVEGTCVAVLPLATLNGQVTPEEFVRTITQQLQQTYPDFHMVKVTVNPSPDQQGQIATASAEWTNHRGEQMGGVVQFKIGPNAEGNTGVVLISQQAPIVAWKSASPVLYAIYRSFKQTVH